MTIDMIKEMSPQLIFIIILCINLLTSLIDQGRNFIASLIATSILVTLTYWGGFFNIILNR